MEQRAIARARRVDSLAKVLCGHSLEEGGLRRSRCQLLLVVPPLPRRDSCELSVAAGVFGPRHPSPGFQPGFSLAFLYEARSLHSRYEWQWSSVKTHALIGIEKIHACSLNLELALRPVESQGQVSPLNEGPQDRCKRETEWLSWRPTKCGDRALESRAERGGDGAQRHAGARD
jgi:hypothetical protein